MLLFGWYLAIVILGLVAYSAAYVEGAVLWLAIGFEVWVDERSTALVGVKDARPQDTDGE